VERRREIIDGLSRLDDDMLVATGAADVAALGDPPGNVHGERLVNQAKLLPDADVIVHHGGCGTTTGAWVHGVPQLVVPDGADRFINADAVVASGTGIALDTTIPSLISKAVQILLDDTAYRGAARVVSEEMMQMPGPSAVLADLTSS
jgi:UDP:flavonoid glycosyltransferase YjiC (YdhE family)